MRAACYLTSPPCRPFTRPAITSRFNDLYTISTPPDIPRALTAVRHSCKHLPYFLTHRPIPSHTRLSFAKFVQWLAARPAGRGLILDSGCGTGRSALLLARIMPACDVVGVDKSEVRLRRTEVYRRYCGVPPGVENAFLIRADLVDFWRLCLQNRINPTHHYLLYPNPFPKLKSLKV